MLFSETTGLEVFYEGKKYTKLSDGMTSVSSGCFCDTPCIEHDCDTCEICYLKEHFPPCSCLPAEWELIRIVPGSSLDISLSEAGSIAHMVTGVAYRQILPYRQIESWDQVDHNHSTVIYGGQLRDVRGLDLISQLGQFEIPRFLDVGGSVPVDMDAPRISTEELLTILGEKKLHQTSQVDPRSADEYKNYYWYNKHESGCETPCGRVAQLSKGVWVIF